MTYCLWRPGEDFLITRLHTAAYGLAHWALDILEGLFSAS